MPIKPEVADWWRRQAWLPQISRPAVIEQPQTGQSYRRPSSVKEYLLGETEEDRKKRELLETIRQRQQQIDQAGREGLLGQATGDGFSEEAGPLPFIERLRQANAQEPVAAGAVSGRLQNDGVSNQTKRLVDQSYQQRIDAADADDPSLVTSREKLIDAVYGPYKRNSQRNIRAQAGRVPGYQPQGLTADEQDRVSRRLMGAARGGMVDETSGLNSRLGAYQAAAARDHASELQQQAEQKKMSDRFQALRATHAPDAKVTETIELNRRPQSGRPGGTVRTYAERIAGVEDDPATPADESLRYRAQWENPEAKDALKAKGLANARDRRQARQDKNASIREKFLAQQAEQNRQTELSNVLRQMMSLDAATKGNAHATSTFMSILGQRPQVAESDKSEDAERDRRVSVALALLDPQSSDSDKEMGRSILQGLFNGTEVSAESSVTAEEDARNDRVRQIESDAKAAAGNPSVAARIILRGLSSKDIDAAYATELATAIGSDTLRIVQNQVSRSEKQSRQELPERLRRADQLQLQGSVPGMRTF